MARVELEGGAMELEFIEQQTLSGTLRTLDVKCTKKYVYAIKIRFQNADLYDRYMR